MTHVLSLRDLRLASTTGHVINIPANTPTEIPAELLTEAYRFGCISVDPETQETQPDVEVKEPGDPLDREAHVREAIKKVIAAGDPQDIKRDGVPKNYAVTREIEESLRPVTAGEIFDQFSQMDFAGELETQPAE